MKSFNVLVVGGNHHNTLGVIRSLGIRKIFPDVIIVGDDKKPYVAKSRYISAFKQLGNYDECLDYMLSEYEVGSDGTVVICTSDNASRMVDEHYELLKKIYLIPNALESGRISLYMDKYRMADLAKESGLRIPQSKVVDKLDSLDDIIYPCVLKPLRSVDGSKTDIVKCYTQDDIEEHFNSETLCRLFLAQEYIDRSFEFQLIGCSLDGGETVIIPGVSKIIRANEGSNTGFLRYERLDDSYPIDKCITFIRKIGYSGLFSMEFLRDKLGNDYFLEINFRNDGNAIAVTAAGVNLPYVWYLHSIGKQHANEVTDIKPVYVMPEFDELLSVYKGKLSLWKWIEELFKADCYMEFDFKDQQPFWSRLSFYFGHFINKIFANRR